MCLFGYPQSIPFRQLFFFYRSSSPSDIRRESRTVVPEPPLESPPPTTALPCPPPPPPSASAAPLLPPPIPPLRLEEIRQMVADDLERSRQIEIQAIRNDRYDGFVDIEDCNDGEIDSISRHSIASDRLVSIENNLADAYLEIDPESRCSIATQ